MSYKSKMFKSIVLSALLALPVFGAQRALMYDSVTKDSGQEIHFTSSDNTYVGVPTESDWQSSNTVIQADVDTVTVRNSLVTTDVDRNENNIFINAFRITVNGSLAAYNMVDGFVDAFEDESGVATGEGANFTFIDNTYSFVELDRDFTTNLVALWRCNDDLSDTVVIDSSGAGNPGVATVNTDTLSAIGKINDAFFLSRASTERFTASSFDEAWHEAFGTASRSMMYWWREIDWTPGVGSSFHRSEFGSSPFKPIIILGSVFSGNLTFRIRDDDGDTAQVTSSANTGFTDDTWHHFAVSWDSVTDTLTIWIDGVLEGSATNTSIDIFLRYAAAQTFTIGARNKDGVTFDEGANGGVDAIYLFERTLFQGDVTANFNQGNGTEATSITVGGPMELRSQGGAFTATTEPTKSRLVLLVENTSGFTLNTDFKGFTSKDGGTTWDQVTLVDDGIFLGNVRIFSGTNILTSTGTDMRWRITTENGAMGNQHGAALLWK